MEDKVALKRQINILTYQRDALISEVQKLAAINSGIQALLEQQTELLQNQEKIHDLNNQIENLQEQEIQALKDYISTLQTRVHLLRTSAGIQEPSH